MSNKFKMKGDIPDHKRCPVLLFCTQPPPKVDPTEAWDYFPPIREYQSPPPAQPECSNLVDEDRSRHTPTDENDIRYFPVIRLYQSPPPAQPNLVDRENTRLSSSDSEETRPPASAQPVRYRRRRTTALGGMNIVNEVAEVIILACRP